MPDTAPARHAGDRDTAMEITAFHLGLNVSDILAATLPTFPMLPYRAGRLQPLCYFLGEKVTPLYFHTAAPFGRQYESAFAPLPRGCWWWTVRCIRSSQPPPEGVAPAASGRLPSPLSFEKCSRTASLNPIRLEHRKSQFPFTNHWLFLRCILNLRTRSFKSFCHHKSSLLILARNLIFRPGISLNIHPTAVAGIIMLAIMFHHQANIP